MAGAKKGIRKAEVNDKVVRCRDPRDSRAYRELEEKNRRLLAEKRQMEVQLNLLRKKIGSLTAEKNDLEKQNREQSGKLRAHLTEEFLRLQEEFHAIEAGRSYETFFDDHVLPLQMLLGVAEAYDSLDREKVACYMEDVIRTELSGAVERAGACVCTGREIVLPERGEKNPQQEGLRQKLRDEPLPEIERYIREDRIRAGLGRIALKKRQIVSALGGVFVALQGADREQLTDREFVCGLAAEVRRIFEENGIYPMASSDARVDEFPELKKRFGTAGEHSIRYPGLFIRREEKFEVLGANIGTGD